MRISTLLPIAAAAGAIFAGACGPTYIIERRGGPPPPLYGRVSIEVTDHREPKKGGADPTQIGNERSGWGIPFAIRVDGGMAFQLHDFLARQALDAQIGVLPIGQIAGATSRLIIDVQQYWCDGYPPVFKADAVASATIVDGATGQVRVPGQPFVGHGEAGNCKVALHRMREALAANA
ncbi:MAG TPA: hypothetical protein VIA18_23780, partial [Polyangia bacterium]|nr:hypothetical protein [Polyangia bacterium]